MSLPQRSVSLVHRYFTPFALALVSLALIVSRPAGIYSAVAVGILAFSAFFNWATERWSHKHGFLTRVREARLGVNLAANSFLVFLLLGFWRPIWLLYALTPIATGVYESKTKTLQMAAALSVLLAWAYWINGLRSAPDAAQAAIQAAFIFTMSLFVHEVSHPHE